MTPRDHLSTAVETVQELSVARPELVPGRLGPRRDEPRRSLAEGAQDVRLGVGRVGVAARRRATAGAPVAVVYHTSGSARTDKCFSAVPRDIGAVSRDVEVDTETERRPAFIPAGAVSPHMDRVDAGVAGETERAPEEPLDAGIVLEGWQDAVGFLVTVLLVILLAAATSVVLLPA